MPPHQQSKGGGGERLGGRTKQGDLSAGAAAVLVIILMNMFIRKTGRITSNDMTMTGYLLEFLVWTVFAIMIG